MIVLVALISSCGRVPLLDVSDSSEEYVMYTGKIYSVQGAADLYEIVDLNDRSKKEFSEIVTGLGYSGPEVSKRIKIPLGTRINVQSVKYRPVPWESSVILIVKLDPPVLDENIEVRLPLRGGNVSHKNIIDSTVFSEVKKSDGVMRFEMQGGGGVNVGGLTFEMQRLAAW